MKIQLQNGRVIVGYEFGIGKASHDVFDQQNSCAIRAFLQSINKQGEIGFWEKPIFQDGYESPKGEHDENTTKL